MKGFLTAAVLAALACVATGQANAQTVTVYPVEIRPYDAGAWTNNAYDSNLVCRVSVPAGQSTLLVSQDASNYYFDLQLPNYGYSVTVYNTANPSAPYQLSSLYDRVRFTVANGKHKGQALVMQPSIYNFTTDPYQKYETSNDASVSDVWMSDDGKTDDFTLRLQVNVQGCVAAVVVEAVGVMPPFNRKRVPPAPQLPAISDCQPNNGSCTVPDTLTAHQHLLRGIRKPPAALVTRLTQ